MHSKHLAFSFGPSRIKSVLSNVLFVLEIPCVLRAEEQLPVGYKPIMVLGHPALDVCLAGLGVGLCWGRWGQMASGWSCCSAVWAASVAAHLMNKVLLVHPL